MWRVPSQQVQIVHRGGSSRNEGLRAFHEQMELGAISIFQTTPTTSYAPIQISLLIRLVEGILLSGIPARTGSFRPSCSPRLVECHHTSNPPSPPGICVSDHFSHCARPITSAQGCCFTPSIDLISILCKHAMPGVDSPAIISSLRLKNAQSRLAILVVLRMKAELSPKLI
jgi:hypothetical protein